MKALVLYDSVYGNTEKIAEAVGQVLGKQSETRTIKVSDAKPGDLVGIKILVAGSPTQGGRPTPAMKAFLDNIPAGGLGGISASAFDTGIPSQGRGILMRLLLKMLGYAAPRIARSLKNKGANIVAAPQGFFVQDREGPLAPGEVERAADWAKEISEGAR